MDLVQLLAQAGGFLSFALATAGSALGIGAAGQAAAGAWAREGREGKPLSFLYIVLLSAPLSQTFYGFILLNQMQPGLAGVTTEFLAPKIGAFLGLGLACGMAQFFSAWYQGVIAASGIRALSDNGGKGFGQILISLGVVETVGLLGLIFSMLFIPAGPRPA